MRRGLQSSPPQNIELGQKRKTLRSTASAGHVGGSYKKDPAPRKHAIKIHLYIILIESHLIWDPKGEVFPYIGRNIRNVFRFSGLHEHRITNRSASADLTEDQMEIPSLLFHMITCFLGNVELSHLTIPPYCPIMSRCLLKPLYHEGVFESFPGQKIGKIAGRRTGKNLFRKMFPRGKHRRKFDAPSM